MFLLLMSKPFVFCSIREMLTDWYRVSVLEIRLHIQSLLEIMGRSVLVEFLMFCLLDVCANSVVLLTQHETASQSIYKMYIFYLLIFQETR